ncbi:MAG: family 20 glycosylhydrolase [Tatlockia sp.]|nr:family 20 glycosylhydrolase [Tatlockia sp.]
MLIKFLVIPSLFIFNLTAINPSFATSNYWQNPTLTYKLIINNKYLSYYLAEIELKNLPHTGKWQLAFNSSRPILSLENAELLEQKQGGDFYQIGLTIPKDKEQITFQLKGKFAINKYSDAPSGYFLIDKSSILPLEAITIIPDWQLNPGKEEADNQTKINTSIEGNPIATNLSPETSLIVPIPAELERKEGNFNLNKNTVIIYDLEAKKSAEFFATLIQPATGFILELKENNQTQSKENSILLTTKGVESFDEKQGDEGYILEVKSSAIIIRALSEKGFFYGLQTLRQLAPAKIYSQTPQLDSDWQIPGVYIRDFPRFEYRGLMLDVARNFRSVSEIKRLIDLMSIHKLNYFQWHLSDDEGFRIEIKKYPQLTEIGAWRGYQKNSQGLALMPAYGSGAGNYGGFYTQKEIRDIVRYAADRQITIIPEIDLPGHARAMIVSLAKELIDQNDSSVYTSVQGYHDNVLSPCKKETFQIIDGILSEIAELFPGKFIHVGGDEVPKGAWQKSCMADKFDPKDPHFTELVQNDFMQEIQALIQSKGKIMAGWEEVAGDNSTLASPLRAYIWNSSKIDQSYKNSLEKGFEVIMSPAENLYFDLAYSADPKDPGSYWAGYVDTFSVYSFSPIDSLKGQSSALIKGVQGQLWSEQILSATHLDYLAFPKMTALAELAWSLPTRRNWQNFSERLREKHLPRLDYYGVAYRKKEFS